MQIFVFLWPIWHQEQSSLSDSWTFQSHWVKQKKHTKKHGSLTFKPLLQEIQLKNLSESFSKALTFKLWNKKMHAAETYRNGAKLNYIYPYGFLTNIWLIHPREGHVKFMGEKKANNTKWAKLHSLIGQKWQNSFQ